ncbi:hypothetical protein [Bradyrhizobium canariense]|uniref:hypothetical protein n=1 Tax=Bradyrhizobium canariense TaxID=255045 RepID=UPI0011780740|nr:hypothetical protein [Bradyrhizobium canariense]
MGLLGGLRACYTEFGFGAVARVARFRLRGHPKRVRVQTNSVAVGRDPRPAMLPYCSNSSARPWFGATLVLIFAPLVIILASAATPLPKDAPCLPGHSSSASHCVPSNDAKTAIPKVGPCQTGYTSSGHYCTDQTVTAAGIAAIRKATGGIALTVGAANGNGSATGAATINDAAQSTSVGAIPLTFNDPMFTGMTERTSQVWLSKGQNLSRTSIKEQVSEPASIGMSGDNIVDYCRVESREGFRVGGSGTFTISNCYIKTEGIAGDHADGLQAYSPGSRGTLTIRNTTFHGHNYDATSGIFIADNWTGTIDLQDVVFIGGPFGLRVHPDVGGDNQVYLKNVYFVGPFQFGALLLSDAGGHVNHVKLWDNVRNATIVNGVLVPGSLIASPKPVSR